MAHETDELVLRPVREVAQRGADAVANAEAAIEELGGGEHADATGLLAAGQALQKGGKRALGRLEPLIIEKAEKLGDGLRKLMIENGDIVDKRLKLEDLLYDFEDFIEVDTFDKNRFVELQAATKSFALAAIEATRRAVVEPLQEDRPTVFPPLPPLPPTPSPSVTSRSESGRLAKSPITRSAPRPSTNGKEVWPQPPASARRQRSGSKRGDTDSMPPLPPINPQYIQTWEENGSSSSSVHVARRALSPELIRAELERARIAPVSPISPVDHATSFFDAPLPQTPGNRVSTFSSVNSRHSVADPGAVSPMGVPSTIPRSIPQTTSSRGSIQEYIPTPPVSENGASSTMLQGQYQTRDSLSTAPAGPRWRSVDTAVRLTFDDLCGGAKVFRIGERWDGVRKVGGDTPAPKANEYSFDQIHTALEKVLPDVMAQCSHCEYANKYAEVSDDLERSPNANYVAPGIRYRKRFLYKSHVMVHPGARPNFACVFCITTRTKLHESDATIFATPNQLFRHLARHPQPLPEVRGVTVLYGAVPSHHLRARDYDINLTEPPSSPDLPDEEHLAYLPIAKAAKDHVQIPNQPKLSQPDRGTEMLQFMTDARIVGVEFPERWGGKWCSGWHDGVFGAFPAKAVQLEAPRRKGLPPADSMESRRSGVTKWKWEPRGSSSSSWLSFDKGDKISNISWDDPDAWYWTGSNSKGKFGLFPSSHMKLESISDGSLDTNGGRHSSKKSTKPGISLFRRKRDSTAHSEESGR